MASNRSDGVCFSRWMRLAVPLPIRLTPGLPVSFRTRWRRSSVREVISVLILLCRPNMFGGRQRPRIFAHARLRHRSNRATFELPSLVIGELVSLTWRAACAFRLSPCTYAHASPTSWSRSASDGSTERRHVRGYYAPGRVSPAHGDHGSEVRRSQVELVRKPRNSALFLPTWRRASA